MTTKKDYSADQLTFDILTTVVSKEDTEILFARRAINPDDWCYIGAAGFHRMNKQRHFDIYASVMPFNSDYYLVLWYNNGDTTDGRIDKITLLDSHTVTTTTLEIIGFIRAHERTKEQNE